MTQHEDDKILERIAKEREEKFLAEAEKDYDLVEYLIDNPKSIDQCNKIIIYK